VFFFSSRRRHTRWPRDWSSDVCSSDLGKQSILERDLHILLFDSGHFGFEVGTFAMPPCYPWPPQSEARVFAAILLASTGSRVPRSEERRVGKVCRARVAREHRKKKASI